MCQIEKLQELYDECKKMNFDKTSDILEKARSEEEVISAKRFSSVPKQKRKLGLLKGKASVKFANDFELSPEEMLGQK